MFFIFVCPTTGYEEGFPYNPINVKKTWSILRLASLLEDIMIADRSAMSVPMFSALGGTEEVFRDELASENVTKN